MRFSKKWVLVSTAAISSLSAAYASATVTLYPGPGYSLTGGYRASTSSVATLPGVSEASSGGLGSMIATETYYNANSSSSATYSNALLITPGGTTVFNNAPGSTSAYSATTINPAATLISGTTTNTSTGTTSATVWTPNGAAYVLPTPSNSVNSVGVSAATGVSINNAGTVVGGGNVYNGVTLLGTAAYAYFATGTQASPVYASTSVATLLPVAASTATASNQSVSVFGVGPDGTAYGISSSTTNGATITGRFATVWSTGNTAPGSPSTVAGTPLTVTPPAALPYVYNNNSSSGTYNSSGASQVNSINASDVAGGSSSFFAAGSATAVTQPVRWTLATSTVGTVLLVPALYTGGSISAVNANGDAAGVATGTNVQAGVLWKAGTTAYTSLNPITTPFVDPGTGASSIQAAITAGTIAYNVRALNDADFSVGYAQQTNNATTPIDALVWGPTGSVTELNSLVPLVTAGGSTAGFVGLVAAYNITDDGWISGLGVYYDPTDTGYVNTGNPAPASTYGSGTYYRTFEIQDSAAVPEPASAATMLLVGSAGLLRRRRGRVTA